MTYVDTTTTTLAPRHVTVHVDRCAGCQECVVRCPSGALSMEPVTWTAIAHDDACVGCRQCERTCPFSAISVEGPLLVADRFDPPLHHPVELRGNIEETRRGYDTWDEAVAEASRCLECPDPTCMRGCPAHNDIPGFVAAIRERDLERAHAILSRTTVMPDICSRVCNQSTQCEGSCSWSLAGGEPVAIGRLERFIADHAAVPAPVVAPTPEGAALHVAVIGSGPAGIGAAWDLVEAGARVTVFEKDATPGGLPVWGMPDFTLPDDVARRPWRQLVEAGVALRLEHTIGAEDLNGLLDEHDAVIVAHGAGAAIRMAVPGADLEGVVDATYFLKGAKAALETEGGSRAFRQELGVAHSRGVRVLVLGAGNTAMDVARMARRLGLDATCVDWLDERFALARPDELAEARHEGVEVRFSRTLTGLTGAKGRVAHSQLAHTVQGDRSKPPTVTSDHDELDVDLVVMAMGYRLDPSFHDALPNLPIKKRATAMPDGRWKASGILAATASAYSHHAAVGPLALDREVGLWAAAMPVRERVWAVGDALTGPSTVVEAMAQGRRAARAILDARPTRPRGIDAADPGRVARVLVCYESEGGTTRRAAETVADGLRAHGAHVEVLAIDKVGVVELAATDVIVAGTWIEGLVVARVRPAKAMREWLVGLPDLGGRRVAVFCTYLVNPRDAMDELARGFEGKRGVVVASAAFGPHDQDGSIHPLAPEAFANRIWAQALAPRRVRSRAIG